MQAAMQKLREHAIHLIQTEPEENYLPLMRNKAGELDVDLDVKDSDLQALLEIAQTSLIPARAYRGGESLEATESGFLLEGMIKLGEANVIIGQPKVGKSSFSTGLIAALRDRRETFLGKPLSLPGERMPVLIFGTDQSEGDWLHFLRREKLVDDAQRLDPDAVDFFCSMEAGSHFNFTKDGLKRMSAEIEKYQFPLVVIDSLSSMMEPTGIEENTTRYAAPIRNAITTLRKTGATLLIIHHSVKRPNSWDWISECRGSSSISSVFSWGLLMRWVAQEEDGLMRTDRRVGFTGKGRGSAESGGVMGLYDTDDGWVYKDGLEAAQQVERVAQRIGELGGVRASVFDYLTQRAEMGADVCAQELATELNKGITNMSRELNNLRAKGLVQVVREDESAGSRPRRYWSLTTPAMEWSLRDTRGDSSDNFDSFANKINKINVFNSQEMTADQLSQVKESRSPRTPVQVFRSNSWVGGWLIHDARNPDSITVEKLGSPNIRLTSLRWDIDVRPVPTSPDLEPGVELDGVTVFTSESPIPPDLSPESLGF